MYYCLSHMYSVKQISNCGTKFNSASVDIGAMKVDKLEIKPLIYFPF